MCGGGCGGKDSRWTKIELPLLCSVLLSFIPDFVLWCARVEVLNSQSPFKLFLASLCNLQTHTLILFQDKSDVFPSFGNLFSVLCSLISTLSTRVCRGSLCSVRRCPLVVYTVRGLFDSCRLLLHWLLLDTIKSHVYLSDLDRLC